MQPHAVDIITSCPKLITRQLRTVYVPAYTCTTVYHVIYVFIYLFLVIPAQLNSGQTMNNALTHLPHHSTANPLPSIPSRALCLPCSLSSCPAPGCPSPIQEAWPGPLVSERVQGCPRQPLQRETRVSSSKRSTSAVPQEPACAHGQTFRPNPPRLLAVLQRHRQPLLAKGAKPEGLSTMSRPAIPMAKDPLGARTTGKLDLDTTEKSSRAIGDRLRRKRVWRPSEQWSTRWKDAFDRGFG